MLDLILAGLLLAAAPAHADSVRVVDGDTIVLDGRYVRLHGIDALEKAQTCRKGTNDVACGRLSAQYLARLIHGQTVTCAVVGIDRYDRDVALCRVGRRDLSTAMVRAGWALDYPEYSGGMHAAEELEALAAGRGMHAMQYTPPWTWRREQRQGAR